MPALLSYNAIAFGRGEVGSQNTALANGAIGEKRMAFLCWGVCLCGLTQNIVFLDVMGPGNSGWRDSCLPTSRQQEALLFPSVLKDDNLPEDVAASCYGKIMGLSDASAIHQPGEKV